MRKKVALNHLCFADDLLIFSTGSRQSLLKIKDLLNEFYQFSGLKCNPEKCEVYFGGESVQYKAASLAVSGFKEGSLPVRYLGLPLLSGKLRDSDCGVLLEKLTKKVRSWRAKKLTYAGRIQLAASVLMGVIQYWLQLFMFPKKFLRKLHKVCLDFLWHGEESVREKVAWERISRPKKEGGLCVRDLFTWNKACTAKMLWLLMSSPMGGLDAGIQVQGGTFGLWRLRYPVLGLGVEF
ncbi:unnamed protein product [Linum trigynum]|uniref:Reverse transcriptase domain-containing protein n=1 Tax=Linum trigynum TaxID=586398 RepID=A0AAV2EDM1_9ROSI